MPSISVITSVYNCENFIADTIKSVINQTFADWEYILIDDNSSDNSLKIMESFRDPRIHVYHNEFNLGQSSSLNLGIRMSKGKYIARLDHDDLCCVDRFEKQFAYMEAHQQVVLCGSRNDMLIDGVKKICINSIVQNDNQLNFSMPFENMCIAHSAFFIRKSALIDNGIEYQDYKYAEDYDLILHLMQVGRIGCIYEPLITYRVSENNVTNTIDKRIISSDDVEIRSKYVPPSEYNIFEKAVKRELEMKSEFDCLVSQLADFAIRCKVASNVKELKADKCFKKVYYDLMLEQKCKGSVVWKSYIKSSYRYGLMTKPMLYILYTCSIFKKSEKR